MEEDVEWKMEWEERESGGSRIRKGEQGSRREM